MKYLSNYVKDKTSAAFDLHGAFFAFGNEQYDKKAIAGIKYTSMGAGLIAPVDNAKSLQVSLDTIYKDARQQDITENGIKAIITRELGNYECQITGDITDAVDALKAYGITEEQIMLEYKTFYQNCIDNDWF
jgi:hypothetical protein